MTALGKLEKKITPELDVKWRKKFDRQAVYLGNHIYSIANLYSQNPRELFCMFVAAMEEIKTPLLNKE